MQPRRTAPTSAISINFLADPGNQSRVRQLQTAASKAGAFRPMVSLERPAGVERLPMAPADMKFPTHELFTFPPAPAPAPAPAPSRSRSAASAPVPSTVRWSDQQSVVRHAAAVPTSSASEESEYEDYDYDRLLEDMQEVEQKEDADAEGSQSPLRPCHAHFFKGACRYGADCRYQHLAGGPGEKVAAARNLRQQRMKELGGVGGPRGGGVRPSGASPASSSAPPSVQVRLSSSNNGMLADGRVLSGDDWRKANLERQRLESRLNKQNKSQLKQRRSK